MRRFPFKLSRAFSPFSERRFFDPRHHGAHNNTAPHRVAGIVYPAAALGVIYEPRTGRQAYHAGHRGDIISLTVSPCRRFAASGDAASPPRVHVWDAVTGAGGLTH